MYCNLWLWLDDRRLLLLVSLLFFLWVSDTRLVIGISNSMPNEITTENTAGVWHHDQQERKKTKKEKKLLFRFLSIQFFQDRKLKKIWMTRGKSKWAGHSTTKIQLWLIGVHIIIIIIPYHSFSISCSVSLCNNRITHCQNVWFSQRTFQSSWLHKKCEVFMQDYWFWVRNY